MVNEGAETDGRPIYYSNTSSDPLYPAMSQLGEGTDWQDQIFRTAPIHSHNVSVNGGSENTKFAVVASYFGQEGVVKIKISTVYPCETTSIRKSLKLSTCPPALRSAVFLPIPGVKTEMEEETLPSSMHHSSCRLQFRYTIRQLENTSV